ncbi:vWA domain-containing protein [Mangrovibacterium lignilyticum]|uniref:vWA domain-containing protein n=1 Tax=Mangrovibacterium lignilyticum TaxID=2668052 RepID=UPI0013D3B509|nr:VWA domain-containing protein [Mangrovibacterium lignilyticum]
MNWIPDWELFHWLRPQFLWLLLPAILSPLLYLRAKQRKENWINNVAPHLRKFVVLKGNNRALYVARTSLFIVWILLVVAISGPTWKQIEKPGGEIESSAMFILKVAPSMLLDDLQPNRLERAKFKVNDLLDAKPGVRVGLIAYAGTAHLVIPPTIDYSTILTHLGAIEPRIMPFEGEDLGAAVSLADTVLIDNEAPSNYILLTDKLGANEIALLEKRFKGSKDLLTIMPLSPESGLSSSAQAGNSLPDPLKQLENVSIIQLTLDNSDMEQLAAQLYEKRLFKESPEVQETLWIEFGYFLTIPILLIVLMWFRRGFMVTASLALFMLTSCSNTTDNAWSRLWYSADYMAQKQFEAGDYAAAANTFESNLHKGIAYLKLGDYEEAAKSLQQDTTAIGQYNLGVAYMKMGNYKAALNAFALADQLDDNFTKAKETEQQLNDWIQSQALAELEEAIPDLSDLEDQSTENTNPDEDFGGGGQEATEEQMKEDRMMEEVEDEMHGGKEEDEIPEEFEMNNELDAKKIMIRDVAEDPGEFLKKKFEYQNKKRNQ